MKVMKGNNTYTLFQKELYFPKLFITYAIQKGKK